MKTHVPHVFEQHKRPLWLGVLLASSTPALCLTMMVHLYASRELPNLPFSFYSMFSDFLTILPLSFLVALLVMLVLGLPYVLWLRSHNRLNVVWVCLGATVICGGGAGLISIGLGHPMSDAPLLLGGAGLGLASGIGFCVGVGPYALFRKASW